ncbi:hypothetical protein BGW80DRAFT_1361549 [Lactifluus volemus]|nr:hypothetical protein BGW80DRAFT_1361549 [Lactifluus volemus]
MDCHLVVHLMRPITSRTPLCHPTPLPCFPNATAFQEFHMQRTRFSPGRPGRLGDEPL